MTGTNCDLFTQIVPVIFEPPCIWYGIRKGKTISVLCIMPQRFTDVCVRSQCFTPAGFAEAKSGLVWRCVLRRGAGQHHRKAPPQFGQWPGYPTAKWRVPLPGTVECCGNRLMFDHQFSHEEGRTKCWIWCVKCLGTSTIRTVVMNFTWSYVERLTAEKEATMWQP